MRLRRVVLAELGAAERAALVRRSAGLGVDVRAAAREIVESVRRGGDAAVRAANARFGGGLPGSADGGPAPLRLDPARLADAAEALPRDVRDGLETMIRHIERFHAAQVPPAEQWVDVAPGIRVGRAWRPLARPAAYVPGGEAAYPSTLVMCAVPARLAGTGPLVVASPAGRHGTLSPTLLGAAGLLGIEEFHVMGGAQAIAALAVGTETVAPVDKIVGPGNAWVTAAKLEVVGEVEIDMPAGPSEVMVLADGSADPGHVAADLLSQAEHGPDSPAVLVTPDAALADRVEREIARRLPTLERQAHLRASLGSAGSIVVTSSLDEAIDFANEYAPEHLSVVVADLDAAAARIRNAGSVFLGPWAPESAGDYAAGGNHVLPTGRLARARGPLAVEDFGHWVQFQRLDLAGLASIAPAVAALAEAEGLVAHRRAVEARFEEPSA